jgi:hypothetical protein
VLAKIRFLQRSLIRTVLATGVIVVFAFQTSLPAASSLKEDESVELYPAIASQVDGGWKFDVQGLVYELEKPGRTAQFLRKLAGVDEDNLTAEEIKIYRERIRYFLADNERGKALVLRFGTNEFPMSTSAANGRFDGSFLIPEEAWPQRELGVTNGVVQVTAWVGDGDTWRTASLQIHVVRAQGWSVISDIDDTIKISNVRDRSTLLKNTFFRPFKPAPGMAGLYREWSHEVSPQFHYLSASPGQLFVPLSQFVQAHDFPLGTFHLKPFRLKDSSVGQMLAPQNSYKSAAIEKLLRQFPKRRFVLVGDSGEQDPEIYGSVARIFPRQVTRIFIRNVTQEPAAAPRYQRAFAELPAGSWIVFEHPDQIEPSQREW